MKITLTTPFLYQNPQTGSPSTTTLTCTQLCRLLCPPTTTNTTDTTIRPSSFLNPSTRILGYNSHTQSYNVEGWQMANQVDVIREACDFWYYETQKNGRVDTTEQTKSSFDGGAGNDDAVENQDEAVTTTTATAAVIEGPISTRALSKLYHVDKLISGATRVYRNSSSFADAGGVAGDCGDAGDTATNKNNGGRNDNQATQQQRHKHEGWKQINQLDNLQMAMEAFREVVEMPSSWLVNDNDNNHGAGDALTTSVGDGGDVSQNASNNKSRSGVNHGADNNNVDQMTFDGDDIATNNNDVRSNNNNADDDDDILQQQQQQEQTVADELEAFLSSTDHLAPHAPNASSSTGAADDQDDDQEEYESDGGTRYIRDCQSGNWIHEALMMQQQQQQQQRRGSNGVTNGSNSGGGNGGDQRAVQSNISNIEATTTATTTTTSTATKKRKRKKPKFSAKSARNWIYVTGLPLDTTEEELSKYFSKVGIIDIDPESLKPKIKLYRHKQPQQGQTSLGEEEEGGQLKGDASICYARPESVELALQILDENLFRDGAILSVQRAKFEQHGSTLFDTTDKSGGKGGGKRRIISESKRRVARLAAIQAVGWDESENGRIAGGLKGLRIIVLMNMFDPRELEHDNDDNYDEENNNDTRLRTLEREIHTECEEIGTVEKITIFSKHPAGVVIVKFVKPNDASDAVNAFNGKVRGNGRKVEASFWDGTTDYTVVNVAKEERETEKRLDKFGDWLEEQELPEEFQLRVENED